MKDEPLTPDPPSPPGPLDAMYGLPPRPAPAHQQVAPSEVYPPSDRQAQHLHCPRCHNPITLVDERSDEVVCPGCGSSFRPRGAVPATTTGYLRQLGRFQLLDRVGVGAFGAVWRARDTQLDRLVAIKLPHVDLLSAPGQRERFFREARAAAQLRHPGIVTVHEVTTLDDLPAIVSEFVEGVPLKDLLEIRRLTFAEAAGFIAEVADALDYAHAMGLVHRDIKPANLMVQAGRPGAADRSRSAGDNAPAGAKAAVGKAIILDLGLALHVGAEGALTVEGQIVGTPAYMSPEQASGHGHHVDGRCDVYSLGVVLYELLCGELPFRGSRVMILHQVLQDEPRPPRRINDAIPRDLETICLTALAKAPGRRYQTARALGDDLRRFLDGVPIRARPVGRAERLWRWCRRKPLVASLLGTLLLVAVAGFAGVTSQWLRAEAGWARVVQQEALERERLAALRAECQQLFEAGERDFDRHRWLEARLQFGQALARVGAEPELADLRARAQGWSAKADAQLSLEAGRRRDGELRLQALAQVEDFRRLADELTFYAAGTNAVPEQSPYYDVRQAERAGRAALAIADAWGSGWQKLPLADQRPALQEQLHSVLLLLVQLKLEPAPERQVMPALLALLERARGLGRPSQSDHRLRAECYRQLGESRQADEEQRRADEAGAATALDHFLLGEQCRTRGLGRTGPQPVRTTFPPERELLLQAVDHYRRALAQDPRHYWSHFQLGRCFLSLGRGVEAVDALGTFIVLRPDSPWGYSARGLAQALLRRRREAEHDLQTALQLRPDFRPARLNLGVAHWLAKNEDAARADFDAVLQPPDGQKLVEAAFYRGQLHLLRGRLADARADFQLVVDDNPSFAPGYLFLAQADLLAGRHPDCLNHLTEFLARDRRRRPQGSEAHELHGRLLRLLYLELPDPRRQKECALLALAEFKRAIEGGTASPALWADLGAVLEYLEQLQQAVVVYSKGLDLAPDRVDLLLARGGAYEKQNRFELAEADFARAVRLDGKNAEAHTRLGYLQARRPLAAEAQRAAARALLQRPDDYLILHNVACIYAALSQGDPKRSADYGDLAMALLERAVERWKNAGAGPNELELIKGETVFRSALAARPDYQKLIEAGGR